MRKLKDRRKKIAHSKALAKEKELSAKKSKGLKSRIVGAGAAVAPKSALRAAPMGCSSLDYSADLQSERLC